MKRSILAFVLILSTSLIDAKVQNVCEEVYLQIALVDPTEGQQPIKRSPVVIPSVGINDHTLYFYTPCDGATLQLKNEYEDIEYIVEIPTGTTTLLLPSYLLGDYQLEIIQGRFRYYGYINL